MSKEVQGSTPALPPSRGDEHHKKRGNKLSKLTGWIPGLSKTESGKLDEERVGSIPDGDRAIDDQNEFSTQEMDLTARAGEPKKGKGRWGNVAKRVGRAFRKGKEEKNSEQEGVHSQSSYDLESVGDFVVLDEHGDPIPLDLTQMTATSGADEPSAPSLPERNLEPKRLKELREEKQKLEDLILDVELVKSEEELWREEFNASSNRGNSAPERASIDITKEKSPAELAEQRRKAREESDKAFDEVLYGPQLQEGESEPKSLEELMKKKEKIEHLIKVWEGNNSKRTELGLTQDLYDLVIQLGTTLSHEEKIPLQKKQFWALHKKIYRQYIETQSYFGIAPDMLLDVLHHDGFYVLFPKINDPSQPIVGSISEEEYRSEIGKRTQQERNHILTMMLWSFGVSCKQPNEFSSSKTPTIDSTKKVDLSSWSHPRSVELQIEQANAMLGQAAFMGWREDFLLIRQGLSAIHRACLQAENETPGRYEIARTEINKVLNPPRRSGP